MRRCRVGPVDDMHRSVTATRGRWGGSSVGRHPRAAIIRARPGPARDRPTLELEHHPGRTTLRRPATATAARSARLRSGRPAMRRTVSLMAHVDLAKAEPPRSAARSARSRPTSASRSRSSSSRSSWPSSGRRCSSGSGSSARSAGASCTGCCCSSRSPSPASLAAVGMSGGRIARAFLVGCSWPWSSAVLLALGLPNQAYTAVGENTLPGVEPGVRPLVVGWSSWARSGCSSASSRPPAVGRASAALLRRARRRRGHRCHLGDRRSGHQVGAGIGIAVGYVTWIALMVIDVARDRRRRRRRSRPASSRPRPSRPARRRSRGYRARCRPGPGPSGSGRRSSELTGLEASARAAVDIPAKIKPQPGQGGGGRRRRRVPRCSRGRSGCSARPDERARAGTPDCPKRMLPDEIEKTLRKLGDDGDKVRGTLERDFADYVKKARRTEGPRLGPAAGRRPAAYRRCRPASWRVPHRAAVGGSRAADPDR